MSTQSEDRAPGRPRSRAAEQAVLKATWSLLKQRPLQDLTIAEIARESGVSKPTIYKWWESKAAIAIDAFFAGSRPQIEFTEHESAAVALQEQVLALVRFYRGETGRIVTDLLAEGRRDPKLLEYFREGFLKRRREAARRVIERGIAQGELDPELDIELALDLIYGPVYHRLVWGHHPLSERFGRAIVAQALRGLQIRPTDD